MKRQKTVNTPSRFVETYSKEVKKPELLKEQEVRSLARKVREHGDIAARNKIVVHNLRLVLKWVSKYRYRGTLDELDLVQEGNRGLIRAAERFDYRKASQFSTYASWWINHFLTRAIDDYSQTVRQPVWSRDWMRRVWRASNSLLSTLGRVPFPEEIAKQLGASVADVKKALRQAQLHAVSLDLLIEPGEDEWVSLKDLASLNEHGREESNPTPEDIIEHEETLREACYRIRVVLRHLKDITEADDRAKMMFRMRYGLDGSYEPKSLEEVGKHFHLTRQRVFQILEWVWMHLEKNGLKRNMSEMVLNEDGLDCLLQLKELTGEEVT